MVDEDLVRKRFFAFMLVRLAGLVVFFVGIAIAYTNVLRDGGWPQVGAIVAILGAIDSLVAPLVLKRSWDKADK